MRLQKMNVLGEYELKTPNCMAFRRRAQGFFRPTPRQSFHANESERQQKYFRQCANACCALREQSAIISKHCITFCGAPTPVQIKRSFKGQPMTALTRRSWVPAPSEDHVQHVAALTVAAPSPRVADKISALIDRNAAIHDLECFNLNPAANVMNPAAESALARGLGSRPSLGYPGDKYEMGLEAIEEIEIITAALAAEIFNAGFAEIRVGSGALANLYSFMALCQPGDTIIVPPTSIGGHVTHHEAGCAGLYGLNIVPAAVNSDGFTVDLDQLRAQVRDLTPRLITIGGSLNLFPHPVTEIRSIADEIDAYVLFDAAHQCGLIAGGVWANPLDLGAHLMTMSTYKSLGGPAGGLIVSNSAKIAEKLDTIAFPGMTANFDAAKSAALALTLLDWRECGPAYAEAMVTVAQALAEALIAEDMPVFATDRGITQSHQFALDASGFGGGHSAAQKLRHAGFLTSGIGLPIAALPGEMNGLRLGTPEIVRRGVGVADCSAIAQLFAAALKANDPRHLAAETAALRAQFQGVHFIR
jgi:glycine hydroxymethyltransferase